MRNNSESGFTLLETMIALAIMLVAFASILMVESASVNTSAKAKQMNIVGMLAKKAMIEAEQAFEGKTFDEVKKEETTQLQAPFQDYKITRKIKEMKFPNLGVGGGGGSDKDKSGDNSDSSTDQLTKLLTNFLSKSIREVSVTITWKKGTGEQNFSLSTYWVDLNHEFELSE